MNMQKAYIEVRSATGGDEAKIWATDLLRMYMKFATKKGWKPTPLDDETLLVTGENAYSALQNESGVHRVQRVPATEKRGRIHTSTATVAVLPEIAKTEINVRPDELEWQFYRASSQGGQNVQKVSTAVRLTHKPTGVVVTSERERFQEANRNIALELLRAKLWELQEEKKEKEVAGYRSAVGRGMRSEKIRTYNYARDQVKDHRLGKSFNLSKVMDGDLTKLTSATSKLS